MTFQDSERLENLHCFTEEHSCTELLTYITLNYCSHLDLIIYMECVKKCVKGQI